MPYLDRRTRPARTVAGALAGVLAAAGIAAGVAACNDSPADPPVRPGTTQVLLTDAPFPYDSIAHVSIFVERIDASPSSDTTPANTNWVTIASPNRAFDLLDLQNGKTVPLGVGAIPAGRYHSVRMVLTTDRSSVVDRSGAGVSVRWGSSAGHPTLYALVESPIDVNGDGSVVIDFDVGRSFLCPGTYCAGELLFSPVFRAVDRDATGTITGTVRGDTLSDSSPGLAGATITVFAGDIERLESSSWPVVATGRTDAAGHFTIAFLLPGSYIVRADSPRDAPFTPAVYGGVVVSALQTTTLQTIALPRAGDAGSGGGGGGGVDSTGGGGGNGGGPPTGTVASVRVSPTSGSIAVGDSVVFVGTARDSAGTDLSGEALAWTVSDSAVVRPKGMGTRYLVVRAIAPGTATIAAVARSGARGTATVTVR